MHLLKTSKTLDLDGKIGAGTLAAIEEFQKTVMNVTAPDGRVDPNGKTILTLNQKYLSPRKTPSSTVNLVAKTGLCFPLKTRSAQSYKTGMRSFGSDRAKGRKHAGCDLYGAVGTPIYAMDDGTVSSDLYAFYLGTYAIEITHKNFIARYGEMKGVAAGIKKGVAITKGQVIGYIGELKGLNMSMLHLELYSGKATGPLTNPSNKPYLRRSDLIDPTSILDKAN